jgi:hypothetical protein
MRDLIEAKLENIGITPAQMTKMSDEVLFAYFCQTFSLQEPLVQIKEDEALIKDNERMKEELKRLYGVERPFICGDMGDTGKDGMREYYLICPAYGADGAAIYKKHKDYSAPEY